MKITKEAWESLAVSIDDQAAAINGKSIRLGYNPEESAKNGGTETVLGMITELESNLRVLKRRLIETLPPEEQSKHSPV